MLKASIDQDLKKALLGGDKVLATTLRGLKSAILYVEVAKGVRDAGLPDDDIIALLSKEAKKRQESADLYQKGGNQERADLELAEKKVIESYLPQQLSDEDLSKIIQEVAAGVTGGGGSAMGEIIGTVKQRTSGQADGARIAQLVKQHLGI
jgi:uncharacterized protein YqeY